MQLTPSPCVCGGCLTSFSSGSRDFLTGSLLLLYFALVHKNTSTRSHWSHDHMISRIIPLHLGNQSWLNMERVTRGGKARWYVAGYGRSSTHYAIIWKSCDENILCVFDRSVCVWLQLHPNWDLYPVVLARVKFTFKQALPQLLSLTDCCMLHYTYLFPRGLKGLHVRVFASKYSLKLSKNIFRVLVGCRKYQCIVSQRSTEDSEVRCLEACYTLYK